MVSNLSHIEVELRGLLPYSRYDGLAGRLKTEGHLISREREENIYYKDVSLRLRRTEAKVTLTAKGGGTADTAREEIEVGLASVEEFDRAASLLRMLGYEAIGGTQVRSRERYEYSGAAITIEYYPDFHAYGFEVEKVVSSADEVDRAQAELAGIANELGLKTYSKEVFFGVMQVVEQILGSGLSLGNFVVATQDTLKKIVPGADASVLVALDEIRAELMRQ